MKKKFLPLFAVLFAFVFALALAGCGGSSDSAADDAAGDAGAAVEQAADDAAAAADEYADVNPDLKAIGDRLLPLSDEFVGLVEQAKAADDPTDILVKIGELNGPLNEISADIQKIDQSTLTSADEAYFNEVLMPALNDMLDSSNDLLDMI